MKTFIVVNGFLLATLASINASADETNPSTLASIDASTVSRVLKAERIAHHIDRHGKIHTAASIKVSVISANNLPNYVLTEN